MWRSATSSERLLLALAGLCAVLCGLAWTRPAAAKVLLSVDEALALAFPGALIERGTVYLTPAELERASALAQVEVAGAVVHPYVAVRDGVRAGTAYFDTHQVRTLEETVMVALGPEGTVKRVETIVFAEPADYLARPKWYEQFRGRSLDTDLALGRGIRGMTGASLTARATTAAVRRVLALDQVIAGRAVRGAP